MSANSPHQTLLPIAQIQFRRKAPQLQPRTPLGMLSWCACLTFVGTPQLGQITALSLNSFPHSRQNILWVSQLFFLRFADVFQSDQNAT